MKKNIHIGLLLFLSQLFAVAQNIIITEKPLTIEDTTLTSLVNLNEIDVTNQNAYGIIKIEDAGFFDLFGSPTGNDLFLYHTKHAGAHAEAAKKTGAIGWNCWFGALNQSKVKAILELKSKNQSNPGEISLFAVSYNPNGTGTTYLFFDLLPDINASSSFPDFENNSYINSSVDAVNNMAISDSPKDANTTITIEYTNSKGELKKISQALKFKGLKSQYIFDERYPSKNTRKPKHYVYNELPEGYQSNSFNEKDAELSKAKAIELFEQAQSGAKVKYINYVQSYSTTNKVDGTIKSKAARCTIVYSENDKCFFGDVYFRRINNGNGVFSDSEFERFQFEGEINCEKVK